VYIFVNVGMTDLQTCECYTRRPSILMLLMQLYIAVMADAALLDLNWKYITYLHL